MSDITLQEALDEIKKRYMAIANTAEEPVAFGDDLQSDVKESLRKYLKVSIDESDNPYKPNPHFVDQQTAYVDIPGSTPPLASAEGTGFEGFLSNFTGKSQTTGFESAGDQFNDTNIDPVDVRLEDIVKKAMSSTDVNELLLAVTAVSAGGLGTKLDEVNMLQDLGAQAYAQHTPSAPDGSQESPSSKMQRKISGILQTNRFSPSSNSPFIKDGQLGGSDGGIPYHLQSKLGSYEGGDGPDAKPVDFDTLRQLGVRIMIQATGQDPMVEDSDSLLGEPLFPFTGFSHVQLGNKKVAVADMAAAMIGAKLGIPLRLVIPDSEIDVIPEREIPGFFGFVERQRNLESYGMLNNPEERFGNVSFSMVIIVLTIMLTLMLLAVFFSWLFGLFWTGGLGGPLPGNPASLVKGRHLSKGAKTGNADIWIMEMLGWPIQQFPLPSTFSRGLNLFFGFPPWEDLWDTNKSAGTGGTGATNASPPPSFAEVLDMATNVLYGPGFYVVIMRAVNRDVDQIKDVFQDLSSTPAGGVASGVSNALGLVEAFTSSITWKWVTTLSKIGNAHMQGRNMYSTPLGIKSNPSSEKLTPKNRIRKHRVSSGNNLSSLAFGLQKSTLLLPESIINAHQNVSKTPITALSLITADVPPWALANSADTLKVLAKTRLSPREVTEVQTRHDGEYMPFWFQDLRTNEIISFYAFLTSINENFSADWNAESGIGRVEDVRIYKKTSRSISLSFVVAAMHDSKELSYMWYHIDRFLTMIYPQYTPGSSYKTAEGVQFRMPFSQVISGAPVVRMRLGELFGSNYSPYGIARLFGTETTTFGKKISDAKDSVAQKGLNVAWTRFLNSSIAKRTQELAEWASRNYSFSEGAPKVGEIIRLTSGHTAIEYAVFNRTAKSPGYYGGYPTTIADCTSMYEGAARHNDMADLKHEEGRQDPFAEESSGYMEDPELYVQNCMSSFGHIYFDDAAMGVESPNADGTAVLDMNYTPTYEPLPRIGYVFDTLDTSHWVVEDIFIGVLAADGDNCWVVASPVTLPDGEPTSLVARSDTAIKPNFSANYFCIFKIDMAQTNNPLAATDNIGDPPVGWSALTAVVNAKPPGGPSAQGGSNYSPWATEKKKEFDNSDIGKTYTKLVKDNTASGDMAEQHNFFASGYEGGGDQTAQADNANPIVRSFATVNTLNSNLGGLAGVINSINLEYQDSTWETEAGNRLPKMVAITMEFDVIHDITPGLDSQGGMRAQIHPAPGFGRKLLSDPNAYSGKFGGKKSK